VHTRQVTTPPEAAALGTPPPLVETKLIPPRKRPQLVARPRLLQALDQLDGTELTIVSAPAGGGKSVLVGSWCDSRPGTAVAWVSLDAADDDPVRLWTYVATALERIRGGLGQPALRRLRDPRSTVQAAVHELLAGIAAYREPLVLVLDDVHVLRDDATLRSFEHAVERLPTGTRIVATTRSDPPIRLGRLRANGALGELRAADLAFTLDEARELLVVQEGIDLDETDLQLLVQRSEGWPAGLYLAALWLRDHPDPSAALRDFTGGHRNVADYLSSEVVDALDRMTRDFVLRTSILTRLSGPLCDGVLQRSGSAAILADLARSNLFLVPLDGRGEWFRYHHLFQELLQLELARADPALAVELRRRAGVWCRDRGLLEEALEYLSEAGDDAAVADTLLEHHRSLIRTGRAATLMRWVARLPSEELLERPEIAAAAALSSTLLSRPGSERQQLLELVDQATSERPERSSPYLESAVSLVRAVRIDSDIGCAIVHARRAVELGRDGANEVAVPALAALSYALSMAGEPVEARAAARAALDHPDAAERPHGVVYALATLALLETEEGRPSAAEAHVREALDVAAHAGLGTSWTVGLAHTALGSTFLATNQLVAAEREAARGEALRRAPEPTIEGIHALIVLAEIRAARGRIVRATTDLDRARKAIEGFVEAGRLPELAGRVDRRVTVAQDDVPTLVEPPSPAEHAVLLLLASDLTQREVGQQLYLSLNTVKTHTRRLYRKLGASSREEAVARAAVLGLLDEPEAVR
jgi:LuxR family transcriptional regulator, maltose regulon positive regulatory protein